MYPILYRLELFGASFPIHTYGFMMAVGFLTCIFVIAKLAKKENINPDHAVDLAFWMMVVGFLGARLLYVITRISYFVSDPMAIFRVWEGGLVFFGGLLACLIFAFWFLRRYEMRYWKTADVLIPGLVIAHSFGRLGCFAAGCCYGKPTDASWGVKFYSALVDANLRGTALHPTQLYESFALLVTFFGLLWVRKHKVFDGQVALTYLMVYPVIRSVIEVYRGDQIRGFIIENALSTSQFISIFVFGSALYFMLKQVKKAQAGS